MNPFVLAAILSGVLPPASEVPLMLSGESRSVLLEDGSAWVRILEQDYVFLRVSSDPAASLTAYDEEGEVLATSERGGLLLSAFADYWFFVEVKGAPGSSVEITVADKAPVLMAPTSVQSGAVSANEMSEAFRFVPPREGAWRFELDGTSSTDLDLDVYGPGMDLWSGGYSAEGDETVQVCAMPSETLVVVVSRYNKAGDGAFSLSATRTGAFPSLSGTRTGTLDGNNYVARFRVAASDLRRMLDLGSSSESGDIDLALYDIEGEYLAGSSTYSCQEALLLPVGGDGYIAEVTAYDFGDSDRIRYEISEMGGLEAVRGERLDTLVTLSSGRSFVVGISPPSGCMLEIAALFEKTRDGDFTVFRSDGPPVVSLTTERGDERLAMWVEGGDTLWVSPGFASNVDATECRLTISPSRPAVLSGTVRGQLDPSAPVAVFQARSEADAVLSIRLRGAERETDFDLFVSGPGLDRMAQGWVSSADAAGDEEISFHTREAATYAVTVYTYERNGQGPFTLSAEIIPDEPLAAPGGPGETWAVIAGISGYPSAAAVLDRASMDALDFYRFLVTGQGVDPDHIILLVDETATADAFRGAVGEALSAAGEGDVLYVFFSGHGGQDVPGSGGTEEADATDETICLYDEDVSDDWLAGKLSGNAAGVVLLADACHSGGLVNDFDEGSNVLVLTAAREDLSVSERILTPILLDGAGGEADEDGNGLVTAGELATYVDSRLQLVCPVCDATIDPRTAQCPDCGSVLKGENRVPRPEQGVFVDPGTVLAVTRGGGSGR
ncbi:MAG: caspase family protein [Candidatus Fermentibacter sp.]|nr:caspase family protein [Candidatus Fermentibacter sp.]